MNNANNHLGSLAVFEGNKVLIKNNKVLIKNNKVLIKNNKVLIKNNVSYHLCQASLTDLPAIVAIYNQSVGFANADFAPVSVASRQAWFLAHDTNRPIWVLKTADAVAAWVSLSNLYDRAAYVPSTEISVYVDQAHAGLGLGRYLVKAMLAYAPSIGVHNVVALIFAHNQASLALFTGLGFDRWGVLPAIALSQGAMADVVILGIKLDNR